MPAVTPAAPAVKAVPATTRWRQFANASGVAASGRSTCNIPIAENVHRIQFRFQAAGGAALTRAQLITDIADFTIKINGTNIVDHLNTTQLLDLFKYYHDAEGALAAPLGIVEIPFVRSDLPVWPLNRAFALGMVGNSGGLNALSYEINYTAGLVTAATCEVHVEYDLYPPETLGYHVQLKNYARSAVTGTGQIPIEDLPKAHKGVLAYHFAAGTITRWTVAKGSQMVFDGTPVDTLIVSHNRQGRTDQTGYFHLDFAGNNDLNAYEELGSMAPSWVVKPTYSVSAAGACVITAEEIHDAAVEGI